MKTVLILGAGFGGLEVAAQLSDTLADEVRVILIDHNDGFTFGVLQDHPGRGPTHK
ncbi:hypothetical protein [Mycolicibacterium tusciae]|uniref:hypothetical protein n=1 Tax=Mycolicibacterium tusciae TaxID=75922 RepID=UPI00024A3EE3|nr:hypothetical protein [Mycolicibacterium tusciae]